jgi:hypothetical protein
MISWPAAGSGANSSAKIRRSIASVSAGKSAA